MSRYVIRVELNGHPPVATYDALHAALAAKGAVRTIRADDGRWYHMPRATYVAESPHPRMAVLNDVQGIANLFWADNDIFVADYIGASFRLRELEVALRA